MRRIFDYLFRCRHRGNFTWPRGRAGALTRTCLTCGTSVPYAFPQHEGELSAYSPNWEIGGETPESVRETYSQWPTEEDFRRDASLTRKIT
jgi:hypothetical protein